MLAIETIWLDGWWHYRMWDGGKMIFESMIREGGDVLFEDVIWDHNGARDMAESYGTIPKDTAGEDLRHGEGTEGRGADEHVQ